ncbi:MAG: DNA translocase FtsK [Treponema sp.]|nr:DNA translocase FtsK [Treponema sp.]
MLLKDIGSHLITKFRVMELTGAVLLGILSIIMSISIAGALFNGSGILFGVGDFFVDSLGFLAFGIPAYLFYAAFLLASPIYRPDRIFVLSCSLVPFLTLAIGFVFIRDFDYWAEHFAFFNWVGKGGFNFFVILLTVIEGLIIAAFTSLFFFRYGPEDNRSNSEAMDLHGSSEEGSRQSSESFWSAWKPSKGRAAILLPPVPKRSSSGKFEDSAPGGPGHEDPFPNEYGIEEFDIENIRLPDIKPLATVTVFHELESLSSPSMYKAAPKIESGEPRYSPRRAVYRDDETDIIIENTGGSERERHGKAAYDSPSQGIDKNAVLSPEFPSSWDPYRIPVKGILNQYPGGRYRLIDQAAEDTSVILKETLREFNIQAEVAGIRQGPVITLFEILPAPGVKLSKIVNLQDNIALRLAAASIRIVAPLPGKQAVGIEIPNAKRNIVSFMEIIEEELHREGKKPEIPVILGRDITGEAQVMDLVQMPHLLMAGAAGSGKSVCINGLILSILYRRSPAECRLILIDPKIAALKRYNDIPHLLTPVIADPKRAFQALQYCIFEMERRYACLDSLGVRDIRSYNQRIRERGIGVDHLPYIVVVIDEFADLIAVAGRELESILARLAAMSRAVGIHLVMATQRPSIDVITGRIKANISSRIAFMVAGKMDSRIIMDMAGAEKLLGKGDMLYAGTADPVPIRMQGAFVSEEEVERVVEYVKTLGDPDYIDDEFFIDDEDPASSIFAEGEDPLYERAAEIVIQQGKASAGYIQRRLKIGSNRAVRLIEAMERRGLIVPDQDSKPEESSD